MNAIFKIWIDWLASLIISLLTETVLGFCFVLVIVFMTIVGIFSFIRRLNL